MKRFVILTLTFVLALSVMTVFAQEDTGDMAEETSIVYIQDVAAGTFEDNGDDTYILTLEGIDDEVSYLQSLPSLSSDFMPAAMLYGGWSAMEELAVAETILRLETGTITLTLSNPEYTAGVDGGTLTFTVMVEEMSIEGASSKKGAKVPESFEEATLFFITDGDFASAVDEGIEELGLRVQT